MNCSATEHVPCKLNNGIERKHQMERFERSEPKVAGLGLSQLPVELQNMKLWKIAL